MPHSMNPSNTQWVSHQFIQRGTARVVTETLTADRVIRTVYSGIRENAGFAFKLLVSKQMSRLLGALSYDFPLKRPVRDPRKLFASHGIDLGEAVEPLQTFTSYRKVFERKIRFWELRPMDEARETAVSPADSRVVLGSFSDHRAVFIKNKFFGFPELLGRDKTQWCEIFQEGDFCIFRLTPEKYHYNHTPVAGRIEEIYEIDGDCHSCNPGAVVREVTPHSKNRRVVTILDTDVAGGTGLGRVAMVEVVAMMIGDIVQCYSKNRYEDPVVPAPGMFLEKGCPKSLFRPGSSTTILIFEKNRIKFSSDLLENLSRRDVSSRFSNWLGHPLVETDLLVRSPIGQAAQNGRSRLA